MGYSAKKLIAGIAAEMGFNFFQQLGDMVLDEITGEIAHGTVAGQQFHALPQIRERGLVIAVLFQRLG